ncbi:hypothetical protein EU96_1335 [Prochlorococcus marinus str. MIT 9302]|uniref:Uncharacterized protein n=1 Tax=Prochlorococcus marinus str. MIT 9302 TaxID=74545 RepID=A0A0A2A9Y8_PROMR|nr:hypothetical protein EU96_1335 [Prochlorococcus marinus str. MIT 9302]
MGIGWPVSLIRGCTVMQAVASNAKVLMKLVGLEAKTQIR